MYRLQHSSGWVGASIAVPKALRTYADATGTHTVSAGSDLAAHPDIMALLGLTVYVAPEPEPETLAAAQSRRLAEFRAGAAEAIAANVPAPWDVLRAVSTAEYAAWVEDYLALVAAELSRLEAAVEAAADVAAVDALVTDWPEVE